jgi:hypothetical protein
MIDSLLTALEPRLTEALAGLLVILFGVVASMVRRAFEGVPGLIRQHLGAQAEKIWREALHRALASGVLSTDGISDEAARLDAILNYAHRSSPDAIAALGASPDVMRQLAKAKLREIGPHSLSVVPADPDQGSLFDAPIATTLPAYDAPLSPGSGAKA